MIGLITSVVLAGSYSSVNVSNQVGGDGNVYTYIETEVDGEKQVLEATGPGEYKLENSTFVVEKKQEQEEINKDTSKIESEDKKEMKKEKANLPQKSFSTLVIQIKQSIKNWWLNLSRLFH